MYREKHPMEALSTDALGKAPILGAGLGLGGLALNQRNKGANSQLWARALMSRENDPKNNTHPDRALFGKDVAPDVSRHFGGFSERGGGKDGPKALVPDKQRDATTRRFLSRFNGDEPAARQAMTEHYNFSKALQDAKAKGSGLLKEHAGQGGVRGFIADHIAPNELEHLHDVARRTGLGSNADKELLKSILTEHMGSEASTSAHGAGLIQNFIKNQNSPQFHASSPFWRKNKLPLAVGAGIAAGGYGLHKMMKLVQNLRHSPEQIKEWQRNGLKERGQFGEAAAL
jgi:hypothetical protein